MAQTSTVNNSSNIDLQRPFQGLLAYGEKNKLQFGGRDIEINELYLLTKRNPLTIVFGKSGTGKTSVLQAGLMPLLREKSFFPIFYRIDFASAKTPLQQLRDFIYEKLKSYDQTAAEFGNKTLWEYFHDIKLSGGSIIPVLILDQFEEVFTIGKDKRDEVKQLITELSDMAENRVPATVYAEYQKRDELLPSHYERQPYRMIIGLREDYIAELESLKNQLPSIQKSRYRILQMTVMQAMESVLKSAGKLIDPSIVREIIKKLPDITEDDFEELTDNNDRDKRMLIEPFLLSLICFQINEKRIERKLEKFTDELVADFEIKDVINSFYNDALKDCPENVHIGIEESLLTDSGYRKLESLEELLSHYQINEANIDSLIDKRLIRKEDRSGVKYIELIHDVLVNVIKEKREKRKKDTEEEERRKKEKEAYRKMKWMAGLILLFALFGAFSSWQWIEANKAKKIALKERNNAEAAKGRAQRSDSLAQKDKAEALLQKNLAKKAEFAANKSAIDALDKTIKAIWSERDALDSKALAEEKTREAEAEKAKADTLARKSAAAQYQKLIRNFVTNEDVFKSNADTSYKLVAYCNHLDTLKNKFHVGGADIIDYETYDKLYFCLKSKGNQYCPVQRGSDADNNFVRNSGPYVEGFLKADSLRAKYIVAITANESGTIIIYSTKNNNLYIHTDNQKPDKKIPMGGKVTAIGYFADSVIYFGLETGNIGYIRYKTAGKFQPIYSNRLYSKITAGNFFIKDSSYYLLATSYMGNATVYNLGLVNNYASSLTPNKKLQGIEMPESYGVINKAKYDDVKDRIVLNTGKGTYLWNPFTDQLFEQLRPLLDSQKLKSIQQQPDCKFY